MAISADPKSVVEKKLRLHSITVTPQRVEIGMLLLLQPSHLSAEQILNRLRQAGSRVSKATVYNTLNVFFRHGIVREVAIDPNHMVYDSSVHAHHHFYNIDTGELVDIDKGKLEIVGLPDLPAGTTAESIEFIVRVRNKR